MPDNPITPSTHSGCEPYAFTNQYLGPDNRRAGETQFAWMTGTAGWYYRAMSEYIIGVRGDFSQGDLREFNRTFETKRSVDPSDHGYGDQMLPRMSADDMRGFAADDGGHAH